MELLYERIERRYLANAIKEQGGIFECFAENKPIEIDGRKWIITEINHLMDGFNPINNKIIIDVVEVQQNENV